MMEHGKVGGAGRPIALVQGGETSTWVLCVAVSFGGDKSLQRERGGPLPIIEDDVMLGITRMR